MRNKLLKVLCISVVTMVMIGCGAVQKVLKTGDHELIYSNALKYYENEQWAKASTLFESVERLYIGSPREDSVRFFNARCKYKDGDYYTASELLDEYRREFGRSQFIEDAEGMYAMCFYYIAPGPTRDQTTTLQAISSIHEFLSRYPKTDKAEAFLDIVDELQGRLYDKSFINAYTYYKIGRHKSAILAFRNALKEYPESTHREDLSFYVVASSYELAKNSISSKQLDRYYSTMDAYYTFVSEYPESKHTKDVKRMAEAAQRFIDKSEASKVE